MKEYLNYIIDKSPAQRVSSFIVRSDWYDFGFHVGDSVYVKLGAIKQNNPSIKKSHKSISDNKFEIINLFLYVTKNLTLKPGAVCLRMENEREGLLGDNKYFFPVSTLLNVPE